MSDSTTEGFEATPAEIEGMVRNLCAYALSEPDPILRYTGLTHQQVLFEGMVEAIRRERGRVLAELVTAGVPAEKVAADTSLGSVPKVRKLISAAGETQRVQEAMTARKAAEREAAVAEKASAKKAAKAEPEPQLPLPLPQHLAAPTTKRLLTEADRAALGLPVAAAPTGKQPTAKQAAGKRPDREQTGKRPDPQEAGKRPLSPDDLAALGVPVHGALIGRRPRKAAKRKAQQNAG